jgi:hypothetical protein
VTAAQKEVRALLMCLWIGGLAPTIARQAAVVDSNRRGIICCDFFLQVLAYNWHGSNTSPTLINIADAA